jgi:3-oxoacyl-[acyl-carrier protein] reductase
LFVQGARLALTYSTNKTAVENLITQLNIQDPSRAVTSHKVDVGNADDIAKLYEEIQTSHNQAGPDILISNAGYGKRISDIVDIPVAEFETMIRVNLLSSFILCKLAVPYMVSQK